SVLVNGMAPPPFTPLPGGTHAWTLVPLGLQGPEHVVAGLGKMNVIVHGYNAEYSPDPGLGRTPGSYGYPAPTAEPQCLLFPHIAAPPSACGGLRIHLDAGATAAFGCATVEYRWLANGVPI